MTTPNFRILVSIVSIFSVEAKAAELSSSMTSIPCVEGCDRTTFVASMPQKVNIFNDEKIDPRVEHPTDGPSGRAFAPIGLIHTSRDVPQDDELTGEVTLKPGQATSFLVSPCFILANYHAVFGDSRSSNKDFVANFYATNGTGKSYYRIRATPEVWGPRDSDPRLQNDWALLKLDVCEGKKIGWMEIALRQTSELLDGNLQSIGHPGDKDVLKLWKDPSCTVKDVQLPGYKNMFGHTCASRGGSSGMPIYDLKEGYPQVLAIHAGSKAPKSQILKNYSAESANLAIDIRYIYSKIQNIIESDKKAFGARNPALPPEVCGAPNGTARLGC